MPLHERERAKAFRLFRSVQPPSREMAAELLSSQPAVKTGGRLLFVNDPFPKDEYFLLFLARLLYHDMTLDIVRTAVRSMPKNEYRHLDAVFVFENGRLVRIAPTSAT